METLTRKTKKFSIVPFVFLNFRIVFTGKWFKSVILTEEQTKEHIMEQGNGWSQDYYRVSNWKLKSIN